MESETPFLDIFLLSALCLHCIPSMNSSPTLLGSCNFVGQICLSWTLRTGGAIGLLGLMKYFHSFGLFRCGDMISSQFQPVRSHPMTLVKMTESSGGLWWRPGASGSHLAISCMHLVCHFMNAFSSMSGSKGWLRLEGKELVPTFKCRINRELGRCCTLFEDLKYLHRSLQTWSHLFLAVVQWSHLGAEVLSSFPLGNQVRVQASVHPSHSTLRCTWAHLTPLSPVWWPCLLFMHCV